MPLTWKCCGIQSGNFRKHSQFIQSLSNHCRWYHWGNVSNYSLNGFTWMPYPTRRFPRR